MIAFESRRPLFSAADNRAQAASAACSASRITAPFKRYACSVLSISTFKESISSILSSLNSLRFRYAQPTCLRLVGRTKLVGPHALRAQLIGSVDLPLLSAVLAGALLPETEVVLHHQLPLLLCLIVLTLDRAASMRPTLGSLSCRDSHSHQGYDHDNHQQYADGFHTHSHEIHWIPFWDMCPIE